MFRVLLKDVDFCGVSGATDLMVFPACCYSFFLFSEGG